MYSKEGKLKLETSAHYTPIGKTNITFYDTDVNTADLVFTVTRNNHPLEVSNENTECYLMLKASDGTYIVDNAYVEDPMNGRVRYTIPKEFLSHSGSVKGQVWIAVHGKEDIVTEVEFSFTVKDSLFDSVPAVDKVNYIKSFDDLRRRIQDRVDYIDEAIENSEDYVTEIERTLESGKKDLNNTVTKSKNDVEKTADDAIDKVNSAKDETMEAIDTGDFVESKHFDESVTDINDKLENKANKSFTDRLIEHDFLNLETGFENFNTGEKESDASSQLQYSRVGPLLKIFGTVRNLNTINSNSEIAVATLPDGLKVNVVDITRGETNSGKDFRCRVYPRNSVNFPNQITISDTRNRDGSEANFGADHWLNISLLCAVEVTE